MQAFDYTKPASVDAAVAALGDADATLVAGGQTLLPAMKHRLATPGLLVDIGGLADLKGISADGGVLTIGAGETHADVANSTTVREAIPALAELAGLIGDPAVRHKGTLGGSIANNDPAADYPAALLALRATVTTTKREIGADQFFTGLFETALAPDEIVLRVSFPVPEKAGYAKYAHPASRYALVGVFVAQGSGGVRVAVTGAGEAGVFRAGPIEAALSARFDSDAVPDDAIAEDGLMGDIHASAEYRAALIPAFARRAVDKANQ